MRTIFLIEGGDVVVRRSCRLRRRKSHTRNNGHRRCPNNPWNFASSIKRTLSMPHLLPHVADAIFAAVSVVVGIGLLHWLESEGMLNIKLYEPRMLGSIVIFCGNPAPPLPRSFLVCTACAFMAGILLHWSMTGATNAGNALAVGFNVLLSKLTNHSFSPQSDWLPSLPRSSGNTPWIQLPIS